MQRQEENMNKYIIAKWKKPFWQTAIQYISSCMEKKKTYKNYLVGKRPVGTRG